MLARITVSALGALAALAAGTAQAQAHGCSHGPFSGLYIGANIGVAWADTEQRPVGVGKLSDSDTSLTAGGHIGYNMQCGQIVLGVEADYNYVGLETTTSFVDAFGPISLTSEINSFGTLRGRLGVVVHPHAMIYATAGWAYADVSHTLSDPGVPFRQTNSGFTSGYVIGGGVELLRESRWLLRAEVLYVDLGKESHTYSFTAPGCPPTNCNGRVEWDDSFWVARLGLSYKFGHEPRVVPLK